MRLVYLSTFWTIVVDIIAWFIIHLAVSALMVRVPRSSFNPHGPLYRSRQWEKGGHIYEKYFGIRKWKRLAPDGAGLMRDRGFPKKNLKQRGPKYLSEFWVETCRAELTHWIIILFAPFFFLWNKVGIGWIMIAYALAENLPLITIQRYNRLRFGRILSKMGTRG